MTGVDKDLAVLHSAARARAASFARRDEIDAAHARVEAELSRLREERDAIGAALGEPCGECGAIDWRSDGYLDECLTRRDAAEARCARLQDERDDARAMTRIANSRSARLQQALAEYGLHKESCPFVGWDEDVCTCGFREALAGPDTPARLDGAR